MERAVTTARTAPASLGFWAALDAIVLSPAFLWLCFGLGLLLRVLWMLSVDPKPLSDFDWYYTQGIHLLNGEGYRNAGQPSAFWPVGYSAFLAGLFKLFGVSLLVVRIANLVCYLGFMFVTYLLTRRLFQSERVARLTLFLLAIYPNHIAYTSLAASESLFMLLMMLGVLLILRAGERWTWAIPAGLVWGIACLVRPQLLPIPLLAILLLPMPKPGQGEKRVLITGVVYALLLLCLVPWTIRNYRAFGHVVMVSTNSGGNLLIGNNPWSNGAYTERPEYFRIVGNGNEYERDERAKEYALHWIRTHPMDALKLLPLKFWYLYRGDVEGIRWSLQGIQAKGEPIHEGAATTVVALAEAFYVVIVLACFATLLIAAMRRIGIPLLGLGVILYFTALGLVFYGGSRYHFPVMPWVAMYAAALPDILRRRAVRP